MHSATFCCASWPGGLPREARVAASHTAASRRAGPAVPHGGGVRSSAQGCARAAPHSLMQNHRRASCVISRAQNRFRFISCRKIHLQGGKSSCVTQRVSGVYLKTVPSLAVAGSTKHPVEDQDLFNPGAWSCLPTRFLKIQLNKKTSMAENKRCEALLIGWKDEAASYFTNAYSFCLTPLWRVLMR